MTDQPTPPAIDPTWLDQAETFDDAWHAGWNAAKHDTATILERDELLARRIVALLLQHQANGDLAAWVTSLKPYAERGIPRRTAA